MNEAINEAFIKKIELNHQLLKVLIDSLITSESRNCKFLKIDTRLIICNNGAFIEREINPFCTGYVSIFTTGLDDLEVRKILNYNKLNFCKIINKNNNFFSLRFLTPSEIAEFDPNKEVDFDYKSIKVNELHIEDNYVRSVRDALQISIYCGPVRGGYIFRGQADKSWALEPTLYRTHPSNGIIIEEKLLDLLNSPLKYPYLNTYDPLELLIVARHFGIPTRLLDFTSEILIALYFACYDEKFIDNDGALFIVKKDNFKSLEFYESDYLSLLVPKSLNNQEAFKKRIDINEIVFYEPVIKNPRMRMQDGCFLFFPHISGVDKCDLLLANNVVKLSVSSQFFNNLTYKIIDKNAKKAIIDELDRKYNISSDTIFVNSDHIKAADAYYKIIYESILNTVKT